MEERGWNGEERESVRQREGGGASKVERRREEPRGGKGRSDRFFVVNHRG